MELQPHELSVPVTNPLSPIALCTCHRCAAIQRPLEDPRLEADTVCDDNGLSGRQRVVWTHKPVVDGVSCLCLAMHGQVLCEQVEHCNNIWRGTTFHLLTKNLNMHGESQNVCGNQQLATWPSLDSLRGKPA